MELDFTESLARHAIICSQCGKEIKNHYSSPDSITASFNGHAQEQHFHNISCASKWMAKAEKLSDTPSANNMSIVEASEEEIEFTTAHDSPPKNYPKDKTEYADPENYKYPINNESRVRAAWSYIHMPRNSKKFSPEKLAQVKNKIRHAAKKYGIKLEEK